MSQNREIASAVGVVGMVVLLIVFAGPGWLLLRQRQGAAWQEAEQEAKVMLEESGFLVISNPQTGHVEHVNSLQQEDVDDATIRKIGALRHLVCLHLHCKITDEQVNYLCGLPMLACLSLAHTQVSDDGLACLAESVDLEGLWLSDTMVTNDGLLHVGQMRDLQILDVGGTLVTDQGLKHLACLDRLSVVMLPEITDGGVEYLMEMQNLRVLSVTENKISKEKRRQLDAEMPTLRIIVCAWQ